MPQPQRNDVVIEIAPEHRREISTAGFPVEFDSVSEFAMAALIAYKQRQAKILRIMLPELMATDELLMNDARLFFAVSTFLVATTLVLFKMVDAKFFAGASAVAGLLAVLRIVSILEVWYKNQELENQIKGYLKAHEELQKEES